MREGAGEAARVTKISDKHHAWVFPLFRSMIPAAPTTICPLVDCPLLLTQTKPSPSSTRMPNPTSATLTNRRFRIEIHPWPTDVALMHS